MIEKRISIRLNLEKLSHKKVYEILSSLPNRRKSEYVINAIIMAYEKDNLFDMIKVAVKEAINGTEIPKAGNDEGVENIAIDYLKTL